MHAHLSLYLPLRPHHRAGLGAPGGHGRGGTNGGQAGGGSGKPTLWGGGRQAEEIVPVPREGWGGCEGLGASGGPPSLMAPVQCWGKGRETLPGYRGGWGKFEEQSCLDRMDKEASRESAALPSGQQSLEVGPRSREMCPHLTCRGQEVGFRSRIGAGLIFCFIHNNQRKKLSEN